MIIITIVSENYDEPHYLWQDNNICEKRRTMKSRFIILQAVKFIKWWEGTVRLFWYEKGSAYLGLRLFLMKGRIKGPWMEGSINIGSTFKYFWSEAFY